MSKIYVLDTDISSYFIKGIYETIGQKLQKLPDDSIFITSITVAELLFGAEKRKNKKLTADVNAFISEARILAFDTNAAEVYSKIRTVLEDSGTPIGNMDIMIASVAIANDAVLVTNNSKHFKYIKNLELENWAE
ncbi:MAG: type II toxin-antitoxin system VapC family toxin [Rickettsiales bacterium]|jgi:tRNA(fMet)-specific endonuclease VapC|nr:type II toxin-antitoxin system VapC family toxin [Rickettsiales bacterium]